MKHKKNIFREVIDTRDVIINQLKGANPNDYEYRLIKRKLDALDELLRDLRSLHWISHKSTKKRLNYYLTEADLNCRVTADHFNVDKVNLIEQTVKYASDKIRPAVDSALSRIDQAQSVEAIDEVMKVYRERVSNTSAYGYFLQGISNYLPSPKYNPSLKAEDCLEELMWLGVYSQYAEYLLTKHCNRDKIAHILASISGYNGSAKEREAYKKLFSGDFSLLDNGKQASIQTQVKSMLKWLEDQNPYRSLDQDSKEADDNASDAD